MEQFHLRNFSMFCQFYNSHNQNQLMRLPILNYQPPNPINPIQNNMIYSTSFQNPGNLNQPQSLNMPPPLGLPALKIPSNEVSTKI